MPDRDQSATHAPAALVVVRRIFAAETANFFLLLGTTLFLVVFGLVMVLSSSSVTSYAASDDFFTSFVRQGLFAVVGVPLMLIASRMPATFWKRWATLAIAGGIGLQALVVLTGLGVERGGNTNWLALGAFSLQPSEVTKVALAIWLGSVLSSRIDRLDNLRAIAIPILPVVGIALALVLRGGDLGTTMIMVIIALGTLFFAGAKLRVIIVPIAAIVALLPIAVASGNSRTERIDAWLRGCTSAIDYTTSCWQTVHGWWALAGGGFFGVGIGNSKAKWLWLPEASNDFIFAIIGEELGLLGAIVVLALFVVLTVCFVRIIRASTDPFARITVSAVMVWIIGQAFVNIAVVLGVLPVLGVPLPLMSSGGSALITTLIGIGIVLSFARHHPEPEAVDFPVDDAVRRPARTRGPAR